MGSVALCVKGESVPPLTAMSPKTKSADFSLRVKVTSAVWPAVSVALSAVMAMVGGAVSMVSVTIVRVLLASVPSLFLLPAMSLKVLEAT